MSINKDRRTPEPRDKGHRVRNRWVLEKEVGRGSYGVVWRALDHDATDPLQQFVAIKFIRYDEGRFNALARFMEERDALRQVRHKNVVALIDHGTDATLGPYLVMEWVDGQSEEDFAAKPGVSTAALIGLVRCIALAAHDIHMAGFVHRDIKPTNILIDREGTPKLLDLGIARSINDDDRTPLTPLGRVPGTYPFAAPESGTGPARPTLDVFSLGATIASLMGAKHEMVREPLHIDPKRAEMDSRMHHIHARAIATNPRDRYHSAQAFADDLWSWMVDYAPEETLGERDAPVYPEITYRVEQARRDVRRRRSLLGVLIACVLLTVLASIGWLTARAASARHNAARADADAAVSLLLSIIQSMDPNELMTANGGPLARKRLADLQHVLDKHPTMSPKQRRPIVAAIAATAYSAGDYDTSLARFRELAELEKSIDPNPHWERAYAIMGIGVSQSDLGQHETAEKTLEEAVTMFTSLPRALVFDEMVASSVASLASVKYDIGHRAEARQILQTCLANIAPGTPVHTLLQLRLAPLMSAAGERDAALENYDAAVDAMKQRVLDSNLELLKVRYARAKLLHAMERFEAGLAESLVVATAFERTFGPEDAQTIEAWGMHIQSLGSLEKFDEALSEADRTVKLADEAPSLDSASHCDILIIRARIRIQIGNSIIPRPELTMRSSPSNDQQTLADGHYQHAVEDCNRAIGLLGKPGLGDYDQYAKALSYQCTALRLLRRQAEGEQVIHDALRRACEVASIPVEHASGPPLPPPAVLSILLVKAQIAIEIAPAGTDDATKRAESAVALLRPIADVLRQRPFVDTLGRRIIEAFAIALRQSLHVDEAAIWEKWLQDNP